MNGDDFAVVVGLSKYHELGKPPPHLKGPENDAELVRDWLTDLNGGGLPSANIGFLKSSDFDYPDPGGIALPDRSKIELLFLRLDAIAARNLEAGNGRRVGRRLYVYMSGHGFSPDRDQGCLFTADATANWGGHVHASAWLKWFQEAGYFREFVLWMDCCMDRDPDMPALPPAMRPIRTRDPTGPSCIVFAAQRPLRAVEVAVPEHPDPEHPEEKGHYHGAFTWELVQGLRGAAVDEDGFVTAGSLSDWLRNAVRARLDPAHLQMRDVSQEPEIIKQDDGIVFAGGLPRRTYGVTLRFPLGSLWQEARIWSGRAPTPASSFTIVDEATPIDLRAGFHVVEVPSIRLRHGIQVTRPEEIGVVDSGDPVAPGGAASPLKVVVKVETPGTVVTVVRDPFRSVVQSRGELKAALPFGVYKVRKLVGRDLAGRVVLLDRDVDDLQAPTPAPVVAAVPIPRTAATHEYQQDPARSSADPRRRRLHVRRGDGGEIAVMARVWNGPGGSAPGATPWEGVHVLDQQGEILADLERDGERDAAAPDPWSICTLAVEPGSYFLRQRLRGGRVLEQSLVVPPGNWRLEAYTLRRLQGGGDAAEPLPQLSVLMRRRHEATWGEPPDMLVEQARVALAQGRRILNEELEEALLVKFGDPIAGIIGGHLLLLEHEHGQRADIALLETVVTKLRSLVGDGHPDVQALSLRCASEALRAVGPVAAPPMFERSWRILREECEQHPDLMPEALWKRAQVGVTLPPFLTWADDDAARARYRRALAGAIWAPVEEPAQSAPRAAEPVAAAVASMRPEAVPAMGLALPPSATAAAVAAAPATEGDVRERAARLQVPAPILDALRSEYDEYLTGKK